MSEREVIKGGLHADEILERSAGGLESRAGALMELGSALYVVGETFRYEEEPEAVELARRCDELAEWLTDLSVLPSGELTSWRECARCSGDGKTTGEAPCVECGGAGAVHREQADA